MATKERSADETKSTSQSHLVWNEPSPLTERLKGWWSHTFVKYGVWGLLVVGALYLFMSQKPGPKVNIVSPTKRDVVELVIATGRIRSKETSTISAEITGTVSHIYVDEGAEVKKGQKLVRLVQSDLAHRVKQARLGVKTAKRLLDQARQKPLPADIAVARANVSLALSRLNQIRRELKRGRKLFRSKGISQAELDKLISGGEQAKANLQVARANVQKLLSYPRAPDVAVVEARYFEAQSALALLLSQAAKRIIRAPFSGIIITKRLAVGQVVAPGTPLFVMSSTERVEVFAETDENNLPKLQVGQSAIVVASAYKKQSFKAMLKQIGPSVDSQRGVVGLRLEMKKLPSFALLNMTVDINVEVASWKDAISIPADTLVKREGKNYVMVLNGSRLKLQPITLRGRNSDWLVCQKLPLTAKVVRRGHQMKAGTKVRIAKIKTRRR